MKISDNGIALIKRFEGCELKSYKCPAGIWTIGYGHTKGVEPGMTISKYMAEKYFTEDIEPIEKFLTSNFPKLNQNQFDALCSFVFNFGITKFRNYTIYKWLVKGDYDVVATLFYQYRFAGKQELTGLKNRRIAEAKLFKGETWK